jgi:CRP-like cAMP-binding protein
MSRISSTTIRKSQRKSTFGMQAFFDSASVSKKVAEVRRNEAIFRQGDSPRHIFFIQKGGVKLSVLNNVGKEAVVGILGPGEFFGEGCLTGLLFRMATATAITLPL